MTNRSSRTFCIGKIVGFHSLQGHVKVRPSADHPDWVGEIKKLTLVMPGKDGEEMTVATSRFYKNSVLIKFKGFDSRTSVEHFRDAKLYVEEADLPGLDEGELWADDLAGMALVDAEGKKLGTVKALLSSAGQDFLELFIDGQKDTVLVPYNAHFFPATDAQKREVTVAGLEGFLS